MSDYERKRLEMELRAFTNKNFEKPANCRNLDQIRFYVQELCTKIEEYKREFDYVPNWAYALLAQYTAKQNTLIQREFRSAYSV